MGLAAAVPAHAQDWTFDARRFALGGAGGDNIATRMIEEERSYRAIVLPFGLLQVLRDIDTFNPNSSEFNPVRAVEYVASPLHYVIDREPTDVGTAFVEDIRNARLSRDLNQYRGFVLPDQFTAEGLSSPAFGWTLKVHRGERGAFHGIYVGAGPYSSIRNVVRIDPRLTGLLASEVPVYLPNTRLSIANASLGQTALSLIGGYRGRIN